MLHTHEGLGGRGVFTTRILRDSEVIKSIEQGDIERELWARDQALKNPNYVEIDKFDSKNRIPDAALNNILNVYFGTASKTSSWFIGCFTSDWTPGAGALSNWAGATSGPLATELPNASFTESNRQLATFAAASNRKVVLTNPVSFTLASGVSDVTLYGATLNSIATVAYNATDQILAAATRFESPKSGLGAGDKAEISYEFEANWSS